MRRIMLILLIMAMLLTPSIVIAGDSITVIDNTAAVFFPSALVFQIEAESATAINKIRLHYRVDRLNYTQVISESWPVFTPDKKVKTEWIWDMRRSSLPVGATVIYWWTIENISGSRMSTPEKSIRFNDSRFQWQELTDHPVSLYWYKGDKEFSKELMDTAHQALELISQDTGASLKTPVHIYIYGSTADLQSAMMFPRGWEGGFAAYEYGTINIGISTNDMAWGKRAIAHELGHLVTHQLTFGPYGDLLPTWLDEGLAMHAEGHANETDKKLIQRAHNTNNLISLHSLASPFSTDPMKAALSYAQSQSVVEFLINVYGRDKLSQLLILFKEGSTTDDALHSIYGFDQEKLDSLWRDYLKNEFKVSAESTSSKFNMEYVKGWILHFLAKTL